MRIHLVTKDDLKYVDTLMCEDDISDEVKSILNENNKRWYQVFTESARRQEDEFLLFI